MLSLSGFAGLLTAAVVLVYSRPSATFGLFLRNPAVLKAFRDMICLPFLLVRVFRFVKSSKVKSHCFNPTGLFVRDLMWLQPTLVTARGP